jgi:ABC-2 type transport system permease protein
VSTAAQYLALSRRSIFNTLRQPTAVIPSLLFPLLFLALNSAALGEATTLPGFPQVDSFLQFAFATTVVQGTLFGSIAAGTDIANDIEGGFFERLIAAPASRTSLLVGRLAGSATFAFVQAWLFFLIASLFGLDVEGGVLGMLGLAIVCSILAAGVGAIAVSFGLRTGSTEAVQGSFPLLFALLFLSSAFFPRALMTGWFQDVASLNPFSHLIEALREQVIVGFDLSRLLVGAAVAGGVFVIGAALSGLALRRRLSETS